MTRDNERAQEAAPPTAPPEIHAELSDILREIETEEIPERLLDLARKLQFVLNNGARAAE